MKVIHFSTEKNWRGGEQQIAYLIDELNSHGIENHLICKKNSEMEKYAINQNISFSALSIRNSIDLKAILNVSKIFNQQKADFVHLHTSKAHTIGLAASFWAPDQSFILHRRVSFPIRNSWINRKKYNSKSIKKIVCISNDVASMVGKMVNNTQKIEIIYSGVDLEKFNLSSHNFNIREELKISEDKNIVIGVGALSPEKDFTTFLKTAKITLEEAQNVHFLIVGKGKEAPQLKELYQELGIKKNISFLGFRTDIPSILLQSDIFMLCSQSEGLGTSFIDASAAECALVGTNTGGIPEIIEDGKTGFLATVGNEQELSEKLITILQNQELRHTFAAAAKEKAKAFSKVEMGKYYINLYEKLRE
ncbi:glycosyltransferase [Marivirga tractuosa]|uniref:glycosyltransferase n=1 Tax=Marivirga tractuosa TaxID=1006 RepID=UPI0035CE9827